MSQATESLFAENHEHFFNSIDPSATWAAQDFRSAKVFVRPFGKRDIVPLRCMDMTPTGGSHGNLHPTARIRCHAWQRGCRVAARGARAAAGEAGDRIH